MSDDAGNPSPLPLRWLRAHGLRGLTPWYFIDDRAAEVASMRAEYRREVSSGSQPERDFLPFARRQDMDDVAGFVVEQGAITSKVITVHLTWQAAEVKGFPIIERHPDIWAWMKGAIDDTAGWCSEDDLADVKGG